MPTEPTYLDDWRAASSDEPWSTVAVTPLSKSRRQRIKKSHAQKKEHHKTKAPSSPLYVENGVWSSIQRDRNAQATQIHKWDQKALSAYSKFRKLYGERKFAREFPTQTVSFSDLPGEIRNRIFKDVLFVGSIDFSPKSGRLEDTNTVRNVQHRSYVWNVKSKLGLLRLNTQLNIEASEIFYGLNEFRFSSHCGHDMLRAFCNTIGKDNALRLTNIAEHISWAGSYGTFRDRPAHSSKNCWESFKEVLERRGYHQRGRNAGRFNIERTLTSGKSGLLRYKVILPDEFELYNAGPSGSTRAEDLTPWFDGMAPESLYNTGSLLKLLQKKGDFSNVEITLVVRHREVSASGYAGSTMSGKQGQLRLNAIASAWEMGWTVEEAELEPGGNYTYRAVEKGSILRYPEANDMLPIW